jgi:hypothetical protein
MGSHTSFSSSELQNVGAGFAVITSTHSSSTYNYDIANKTNLILVFRCLIRHYDHRLRDRIQIHVPHT